MQSSMILLLLMNLLILCYGQSTTTTKAPELEYYSPKDVDDIWNPKLKEIIQQNGDYWEFNMTKSTNAEPLEMILFIADRTMLDFTLTPIEWDAFTPGIQGHVSIKIGTVFEKEFHILMTKVVESLFFTIQLNDDAPFLGQLGKSGEKARLLINYEGVITGIFGSSTSVVMVDTLQPLLWPDETYGYLKVSISWTNLPSNVTISIPSTIFRDIRPVSLPTTTSANASASSTSNSTHVLSESSSTEAPAKPMDIWFIIFIIVAVIVVIVIIVAIIIIAIRCYRKKRRGKYAGFKTAVPLNPKNDARRNNNQTVQPSQQQLSGAETRIQPIHQVSGDQTELQSKQQVSNGDATRTQLISQGKTLDDELLSSKKVLKENGIKAQTNPPIAAKPINELESGADGQTSKLPNSKQPLLSSEKKINLNKIAYQQQQKQSNEPEDERYVMFNTIPQTPPPKDCSPFGSNSG